MPFADTVGRIMQASTGRARSTALLPLQWMVAILLAGVAGGLAVSAPEWLAVVLAALIVGVVLLFGGAYLYFMLRDPDALRSERFLLQRLAIEKGTIGDSIAGMRDVVVTASVADPSADQPKIRAEQGKAIE